VWALAVTADESTIISGAADSVVTFWADCTEQEQEEKESKRAELVLKYAATISMVACVLTYLCREQDFQNYLSLQDYRNAILLALVMDQPGRLFTVFRNIRSSRSVAHPSPLLPSLTGHPAVDSVIETLSLPQLARLLTYVRDWNATSRTSTVAQTVLHAILKLRSAEDIVDAFQAKGEIEFDGLKPSSKGAISLKDLVDAMIPYTERHFTRMDTMVQDSYIVDFLLGEMDSGLFLEV
jgi:U3 small nucleolar RNA-associated protein 13